MRKHRPGRRVTYVYSQSPHSVSAFKLNHDDLFPLPADLDVFFTTMALILSCVANAQRSEGGRGGDLDGSVPAKGRTPASPRQHFIYSRQSFDHLCLSGFHFSF